MLFECFLGAFLVFFMKKPLKTYTKGRSGSEHGDFFAKMPKCIWTRVARVQTTLRRIRNREKIGRNVIFTLKSTSKTQEKRPGRVRGASWEGPEELWGGNPGKGSAGSLRLPSAFPVRRGFWSPKRGPGGTHRAPGRAGYPKNLPKSDQKRVLF